MTHPLRTHLEAVGRALRSDAMTARVMGDWDDPTSRPDVRIDPPASAAQLATLEAQIGRLPDGLREVLGEVSAKIEISWSLRAHRVMGPDGYAYIEALVTLPEPFMELSHGLNPDGTPPKGATREPTVLSGGLYFSLERIVKKARSVAGWQDVYRDDPTDDAETRAHNALIRDFMGAGLPVMTAPNGDWLAIDQRDEEGCLLHVSHEGEEAGIEIDLGLPAFLAHLAWLGPVWPDFPEIFTFSKSVENGVPNDPRVRDATFDARSNLGKVWRDWFWGDAGPPAPGPELLRRCGQPIS